MKRTLTEFAKSLMKMMIDTSYVMLLEKLSSKGVMLWTL